LECFARRDAGRGVRSAYRARKTRTPESKMSEDEIVRRAHSIPFTSSNSNLVLDELDRELQRRGDRFVRYAAAP
jgi:hypothetical protein